MNSAKSFSFFLSSPSDALALQSGLCADVTIISAEYTKKVSDAIVISHDETFTANEILYGRAGNYFFSDHPSSVSLPA